MYNVYLCIYISLRNSTAHSFTANSDYRAVNITITIQEKSTGTIPRCASVPIIDDSIVEDDEIFLVMIATPTNDILSIPMGRDVMTVTILDDDGKTSVSLSLYFPSFHHSCSYSSMFTPQSVFLFSLPSYLTFFPFFTLSLSLTHTLSFSHCPSLSLSFQFLIQSYFHYISFSSSCPSRTTSERDYS